MTSSRRNTPANAAGNRWRLTMKSMFLTLAAVLGIALAATSIPTSNANADAPFNSQSGATYPSANANQ